MKKKFLAVSFAAIVFVSVSTIAAQAPTSTRVASGQSQSTYSESAAYKPRLFALKSDSKKKNKKASLDLPKQLGPTIQHTGVPIVENAPLTLPVSVFDVEGKFVGDLKKDDFKVFVDGAEMEIASVEKRPQPLSIILVIDVSVSGADQIKAMRNLALSIMQQFGSDDKFMVAEFSDSLKILSELTTDRMQTRRALEKVRTGNGTALYDVINELFENHVNSIPGRKAVILMTDGVDTTSKKARYSTSLATAEKSDATILPIYIDTFAIARTEISSPSIPPEILQAIQASLRARFGPSDMKAEYEVGKLYLNDLVFLSGGRALPAEDISKGKSKLSPDIAEELRLQYYVTFVPVSKAVDGQRRHVKVRVNRPNLAVLARGSYITGSLSK